MKKKHCLFQFKPFSKKIIVFVKVFSIDDRRSAKVGKEEEGEGRRRRRRKDRVRLRRRDRRTKRRMGRTRRRGRRRRSWLGDD